MSLVLAAAFLWAVGGLAIQALRFGALFQAGYSSPSGSARAGARYALGPGMAPWNKESATAHPVAFAAGALLHLGVAASLGTALGSALAPEGTRRFAVLLAAPLIAGSVAGLGLIVRRARESRALSVPEDYLAALLVALNAVAALAWLAGTWPPLVPQASATLLLFYLPLGKLRHAVFFVLARAELGARLGRRGALPPHGR